MSCSWFWSLRLRLIKIQNDQRIILDSLQSTFTSIWSRLWFFCLAFIMNWLWMQVARAESKQFTQFSSDYVESYCGKMNWVYKTFWITQTSESIHQRTLAGYQREKLNMIFFSNLNFDFVIFIAELFKKFTKKKKNKTFTSLNS